MASWRTKCVIHCTQSKESPAQLTTLQLKNIRTKAEQYVDLEVSKFKDVSKLSMSNIKSYDDDNIQPQAGTSTSTGPEESDSPRCTLLAHSACYVKFSHSRNLVNLKPQKRAAEDDPSLIQEPDNEQSLVGLQTDRPKRSKSTAIVLPEVCIVCGKKNKRNPKRGRGSTKFEGLRLTESLTAYKLIPTAEQRGDERILRQVRGSDAVAREVRYHHSCYKQYIKSPSTPHTESAASISDDTFESMDVDPSPQDESSYAYDQLVTELTVKIVNNKEMVKFTEIKDSYSAILQSYRRERKLWNGQLTDKLMNDIPTLRFYKPRHSQFASLIAYSTEMKLEDLMDRLPVSNPDSTSDDTETDDEFTPLAVNPGSKLELRHVSDLVLGSLSAVPKRYNTWPPKLEDFSLESCMNYAPAELFNLIACITGLMEDVVEDPHHRVELPHHLKLKVASICQDVVYIWSRGRIQPPKSLALGMTLRHLTGNKRVNDILSAFGHAASYRVILGLETALAMSQYDQGIPPEFHLSQTAAVCWDNIDFSNETISGAGSAHFVNGILLQPTSHGPMTPSSMSSTPHNIPKSIRKLPTLEYEMATASRTKRQGPGLLVDATTPDILSPPGDLHDFIYINVRSAQSEAQSIPPWTEYNKCITQARVTPITRIHYLPLILRPATEPDTIATILQRTLHIADTLNIKTITAVFDLAIYAKVQEQRWGDQTSIYRERIIPRLGEFHTTMSYLGIIGKRFGDGGLASLWTEADLVASGSLNGSLSGKHYNRSMRSHKVLFEALYRLQIQEFLSSSDESLRDDLISLTETLTALYKNPEQYHRASEAIQPILTQFQQHKEQRAAQNPTYRYWNSYIDMVQCLLTFIPASRTNDWSLHLTCLEWMIPWFFAYDHSHYSRYLPLYITEMKGMNEDSLSQQETFFTVCRTGQPFTGVPMDMTIEQTVNKACKAAGGVAKVTLNEGSFQRWVLAQPGKAAISELCSMMAGVGLTDDSWESDANITYSKHESMIQSTLDAIASMKNPFEECSDLMNISSRNIASEDIISDIDSAFNKGREQYKVYVAERILSNTKGVFDVIPHLKLKGFTVKKTRGKDTQRDMQRVMMDDRQLYSRLLVVSRVRDPNLKQILSYSLTKYPLSIATSEGCLQKLNKATLMHELETLAENPQLDIAELPPSVLILDAMAVVQAHFVSSPPNTFAELGDAIYSFIVKQSRHYKANRVDWVADQYREHSIKNAERSRRGGDGGQRMAITKWNQRLPKAWRGFLKNSENKRELLNFLYIYMSSKEPLPDLSIIITGTHKAKKLSIGGGVEIPELQSNHEEADTRMILHAIHASRDGQKNVIISSPDTDVLIITLAAVGCEQILSDTAVSILTGTGKARRLIDVSGIALKLGKKLISCLPFLHAFTGCDTVSCFHKKGKKRPLTILRASEKFIDGFSAVSKLLQPADMMMLESFVCTLYGCKTEKVDEARYELYKKGSLPSLLPPNLDCLELHSMRAAYQADIWRDMTAQLNPPSPEESGWVMREGQLEILWSRKPEVPAEVLQTVFCSCKTGCKETSRCSCQKSGLPCTDLCKCSNCSNTTTVDEEEGADTDEEA